MTRPLIEVDCDGERRWHVVADMPGNTHTLCMLALDDGAQDEGGDFVGTRITSTKPKAKQRATCKVCRDVWETVTGLGLRRTDFIDPD